MDLKETFKDYDILPSDVSFCEKLKSEGYIKYEHNPDEGRIISITFSPEFCNIRFERTPLNGRIFFSDLYAFFDAFPKLFEEVTKRTYIYEPKKYLIEYGYINISGFKNRAIFHFDLQTKKLFVYLVDWDSKTTDKVFFRLLKKINRNFEYLKSIKNLLVLSDDISLRFEEDTWKNIFSIIIEKLKERFWLIDENDYYFLASFISLSYFQEILETVPYIFIGGEMGSGKSRVLEALGDMCYRGSFTSNISVAVIARELDWHKTTLLYDEIAKDEEKVTPEEREIFALLRAGIRRGMYYKRMKNDEVIGMYDAFGLKAFSTNRELPSDIKNRCLIITMFKNPRFKPKLDIDVEFINAVLSEYRIYILINNLIDDLKRKVEDMIKNLIDAGIDGRTSEILSPLLFFCPKDMIPKNIKDKISERISEERFTETYYVYLALKKSLSDEIGELNFDNWKKDVEIRFNDVFINFCEYSGMENWDRLSERDKRSITIRIGLILKNKFDFETYRKGKDKERFIKVNPLKFLSFVHRYEEDIEIGDYTLYSFFDELKKLR